MNGTLGSGGRLGFDGRGRVEEGILEVVAGSYDTDFQTPFKDISEKLVG